MTQTAAQTFTGAFDAQPTASTFAFAIRHSGTFWFRGALTDVAARLHNEDGQFVLEMSMKSLGTFNEYARRLSGRLMYLLDTNAFNEASRLYYAFDIVPGFWTWLGDSARTGQVASIEAVRDEITAGTGDLVEWASARPPHLLVDGQPRRSQRYARTCTWATDAARQYARRLSMSSSIPPT